MSRFNEAAKDVLKLEKQFRAVLSVADVVRDAAALEGSVAELRTEREKFRKELDASRGEVEETKKQAALGAALLEKDRSANTQEIEAALQEAKDIVSKAQQEALAVEASADARTKRAYKLLKEKTAVATAEVTELQKQAKVAKDELVTFQAELVKLKARF